MLKIQLISGFYFLGLILSVRGSNPDILIDGTPAPQCGKAPNFSPIRVTGVWREKRPEEKDGDIIVNFYSEKQNGTCPVKAPVTPVPTLNGPCTSDDFCGSIKFSNCLERLCKCLPGYVEALGLCLGKLESKCSEDPECAPASSICHSETCKCPATHYAKDGHCYEYSYRLGFPVHSSEGCRYLKNSVFSSGSCQCARDYVEEAGQCLKNLETICSKDFECAGPSVCSGTCKCPATHYAEDGHCYEYSYRLGFPVHSSESCRYLKNSIFSSGSCQCAGEYVEEAGQCLKKLGTSCSTDFECAGPSVCSGTCKCPATHFLKDEKCYEYLEKLNSLCRYDQQCKIPFSECYNGECRCKRGYAEHDNKCYGLKHAKCNNPTDCATIMFTCKSGICSESYSHKNGQLASSKPETTAIYGEFSGWENLDNLDPKKAGNLIWARNFNLDRVVLIENWISSRSPSVIEIWCRTKSSDGKFYGGKIQFPGDGKCYYWANGVYYAGDDWKTLVDLGPY